MTREDKCRLFEAKGFTYDPETGVITTSKGVVPKPRKKGSISLQMEYAEEKIQLLGHHFAWWMHYREVPDEDLVIDHEDRNPINNRIINLRLTTQSNNVINSDRWENYKGYYFHKQKGKWITRIQVEGKQKYLGTFNTEKEARTAYLTALAFYYPDRYKILEEKGLLD